MKTIWKFPISDNKNYRNYVIHIVPMPIGADILHIALDPTGELCLWAKVESDSSVQNYKIHCIGTGADCTSSPYWNYIGTVNEGPFVWHFFAEDVKVRGVYK